MYTSDTKKTLISYIGIALFLFIFNFIYEKFSFGEHSIYMRYMFVILLVAAVIVFLVSKFSKKGLDRIFLLLFNSSIAIFVSGCIVKGIIEISGRISDYDLYYIIGGSAFLLLSFFRIMFPVKKNIQRQVSSNNNRK